MRLKKLTEQAIKVLEERYLKRDPEGRVCETPDEMFQRVASHIASAEKAYDRSVSERALDFYEMMSRLDFLPNSPCLANAGKNNMSLSACYVLPVGDSLGEIFEAVKSAALIHQTGGGTGFSFSRLRPEGSLVSSTGHVASGPVSFMKVFDAATNAIKQGGMRRGANMGVLRCDHPDVLSFIHCKDDGVSVTNFNISILITEAFMWALENDTTYALYTPQDNSVVGSLSAKKVWREICESAWRTGDPGVIFIDRVNGGKANPIKGWLVGSTNPCGEQPLYDYDSCLTGDTLVMTSSGLRRIDGFHSGDHTVSAHKTDCLSVPATLVPRGHKTVLKVTMEGGIVVRATEDHKFFTNLGEIRADELIETGAQVQWMSNNPLLRTRPANNQSDLSFLLGWMHGDGWMTNNVVGIGFNYKDGDGEIKERVLSTFHQTFGVRKPLKDDEVSYQEQTELKPARQFMQDNGVHLGRAVERRFPTCFYNWELRDQLSFLQALFTADGSVSGKANNQVSLATSSPWFVDDVQQALAGLGIQSRRFVTKFQPGLNRKDQYRLTITKESAHKFMRYIGFATSVKEAKFEVDTHRYVDHMYLSVNSVEYDGEEDVWDLSVEDTHSFFANGVLVHNCNLGSINLGNFIKDGAVHTAKLQETVRLAVRFLDNVIDMNQYVLPEIDSRTKAIRRIGLGVMGWADMLIQLGIPYASWEAVELGGELARFIQKAADNTSENLAAERGAFPLYERSIYSDSRPMRNSTRTTIAPTGTISLIAGCSSGIEPLFALGFEHHGLEGKLQGMEIINPHVEEYLRKNVGIAGEVLRTAHEIAPEWHVRHQAAWQGGVDNAVSKTINLPQDSTVEDIDKVYRMAYEEGCMGITVYRDGCRSNQVLTTGGTHGETTTLDPSVHLRSPKEEETKEGVILPDLGAKQRPSVLQSYTFRQPTPFGNMYVILGEDGGEPYEVFVTIGKAGSDVQAMAEGLGRVTSKFLQASPVGERRYRLGAVAHQLRDIGGSGFFGLGKNKVKSLPDAVGLTLETYLERGTNHVESVVHDSGAVATDGDNLWPVVIDGRVNTGDLCQDCGQFAVYYGGGCPVCQNCGWSKC